MQKARRKVWIGAGMAAVVAVSLAATLGLSNAATIDQQPSAIAQPGLTHNQQAAAMNAAEQAGEAAEEAMEVGDNIADGCEDVGTPQADAATAQGLRAEQAGARALEIIRQVRARIRAGRMNQDNVVDSPALSTAVAQNPNARRSSQRMLNGAAADIDSGAQAMEFARNFLATALNSR